MAGKGPSSGPRSPHTSQGFGMFWNVLEYFGIYSHPKTVLVYMKPNSSFNFVAQFLSYFKRSTMGLIYLLIPLVKLDGNVHARIETNLEDIVHRFYLPPITRLHD